MHGRVVCTEIESLCLRGNPLGDPIRRELHVYLPPGHDEGGRFPLLLLLPGFAGNHRSILSYDPWKPNAVEAFDAQVAAGEAPPAILALPDCTTRWGGSQFLDSAATGLYQTYLAEEIVPHLDATFRTVPDRLARGVAGRSSGGFGALRLAMDRPELVAAVASHAGDAAFEVSMRPMLTTAAIAFDRAGGVEAFARAVTEGGPRGSMDFDAVFVLACSAAYAAEPEAPFPHLELPFESDTGVLRPAGWARWLAHDPLERIAAHADALRRMERIFVDAGDRDEHGLQLAARLRARAIREHGIGVHHEEHEGGHRGTSHRYTRSLPDLLRHLHAD